VSHPVRRLRAKLRFADGLPWKLALATLVALSMAFAAGYLFMSNRRPHASGTDPARELEAAKEHFRRTQLPISEIDLPSLFPGSDPLPFVDPRTVLPQAARYPFAVLARLYQQEESCRAPIVPTADPVLRKATVWQLARCRRIAHLPHGFFETPPFFHPLGHSYAWLAAQNGATPAWIRDHLAYIHAAELGSLGHGAPPLEPTREILAGLGPDALSAVADNDEIVLSGQVVLFRQASLESGAVGWRSVPPNRYAVFPRAAWDGYWAKTAFSPRAAVPGTACVAREGRLCWAPRSREYVMRRPTLLLFASSLLLAILCAGLMINELQAHREQERSRRFALQTLTHELRTPVAGLALTAEELLDEFDHLPENLHGAVLGLCNDVQRLQRVVEASQGYLSTERGLVHLRSQFVPSVRAYLESICEPYEGRVSIAYPETDRGFHLDGYWLGVCLRNLIDNALQHGKPPVEVAFCWIGNELGITVRDAGECAVARFEELARPFVKNPHSTGLGLGLAIVKAVTGAMHAEIRYSPSPTQVSFQLGEWV
jgi:signal transduction histidine kinase